MVLKFELVPSKYFLEQSNQFSQKEKDIISNKLIMLKENPFRFKAMVGYKHLFEIKIDFSNKYSRLIYAVYFPQNNAIRIFGIFNRDKEFKDFYNQFRDELKNIKK